MIASALAVLGCTFTACRKSDNTNEILIADFETYEELTEMRWLNYFGAAELQDEHVTHGNKSLHVSVMGDPNSAAKPVLAIETKTDRVAKYDFTDVEKFTLDVYNDNDYAANIYLQYLTAAENQNITSGEIKVTVPQKTAQTVEFQIDRALSSYFLNLDDVLQIRLAFDPIEELGQEYRSFYIDNLRCYTTSKAYTPTNPRAEDEIESADRPEYLAAWGNILPYIYSPSSLTFNSNPEYVKSGGGSFKLTSERTGGSGELYTIGISCLNSAIEDFSQYASLGYWVFNPYTESEVVIAAWLTGNYYMGDLKQGWNYFEVTQAMFKEAQSGNHNADPTSLESFGLMFQVPDDKSYSVYIDEVRAYKDGLVPVITVDEPDATYPQPGATVTVPKASVKYADGYSVKVYAPDGSLVGSDIESFTAEQFGFYEIVYEATARRADEVEHKYAKAEERIQIAVGSLPTFRTEPQNVFLSETDEYSLVPPECENGTVSWKAEVYNVYYPAYTLLGEVRDINADGYEHGVKTGTGKDSVKIYEGTAVRITYKASNELGLYSTAVQTVFYSSEILLADNSSDIFTADKVDGDLTVVSETEKILGESTGLRLQNENGSASGTFSPSDLYLGASNDNLRFIVYNNGTRPVSFFVNGEGQMVFGEDKEVVELAPGSFLVFNGVMYEGALQAWKIVSADKYLLPLTFSASSDAAVDLFIGRFTVNADSFTPTVSVSDFGVVGVNDEMDLAEYVTVKGAEGYSYRVSYSTLQDGTYEEKASGTSSGTTTYTPNKSGWYKVEYSVAYGEQTITESGIFQVRGRELIMNGVPQDAYVEEGMYTATLPTSEQGTVTWKAELYETFFPGQGGNFRTDINEHGYENGVRTGSGNVEVYVYANHAVRITYTVTDSLEATNTLNVYQTVLNYDTSARLSEAYENFYTGATVTGDITVLGTEKVFGDGGFRLASETTQATGTFTPADNAKYLGGSNGNLRFVVYNNGTSAIMLSGNRFGGNQFTIQPRMSAVFNGILYGYDAALVGWGVITAEGNLNSMEFTATGSSPIDVRIGCFAVNETSFEPKVTPNVAESYFVGTSVDFAETISVTGGEFTYLVRTSDGTMVSSGSSETHDAVNLSEVGTYTVDYTVTYKKGEQTVQKTVTFSFTVVVFTVDLGEEAVKRVKRNDTYAINNGETNNLPTFQQGVTITNWTVQKYPVSALYGSLTPAELASEDYVVKDESGKVTQFAAWEDYAYQIVYTVSNGVVTKEVTQWLLPEEGSRLEEEHPEVFASGYYGVEPGTSMEIGSEHIVTDKPIVAVGEGSVGFNFNPGVALGEDLSGLKFWIMIESDGADTAHLNIGNTGYWGGKEVPTGVWIRANLDLATVLKGWGIVDGNNVFQSLGIRVNGTGNLTVHVDLFSVYKTTTE